MTARRKNHLDRALEHHKIARAEASDVMEGLDLILDLAQRGLKRPRLAGSLLLAIVATCENSITSLEDSAAALSEARKSIEARRRSRR